MSFSKTFPKNVDGSNFPKWEEVFLSEREEKEQEKIAMQESIKTMRGCIDDARGILEDKGLKPFQMNIIGIAIALFEKQASHSVYWKEKKAKEKFDRINS